MTTKKDIQLKKSLIRAKKTIQKKFQDLHDYRLGFERQINKQYKPIIKPLNKLAYSKDDVLKKLKTEEQPQQEFNTPADKQQKRLSELLTIPKSLKDEAIEAIKSSKSRLWPKKLSFEDTPEFDQKTTHTTQTSKSEANSERDENPELDPSTHHLPRSDFDDAAAKGSTPSTSSQAEPQVRFPWEERLNASLAGSRPPNDIHYSLRRMQGEYYLGNTKVLLLSNQIYINNKHFMLTKGLLDLLQSSNPDPTFTKADLNVYKELLTLTNAHRENFSPYGDIVRDKSNSKYKNIVESLFPPPAPKSSVKTRRAKMGKGVSRT